MTHVRQNPSSDTGQVPIPDASEQCHLWDELVTAGFQLALAPGEGDPEGRAARERLSRGMARDLKERDEMWRQMLRRTGPPGR